MKKLGQYIVTRRLIAIGAGLALAGTVGLAQAQTGPGMMGHQAPGYGQEMPMKRGAPQERPGMMGDGMGMMIGPCVMGGGPGMMMGPGMMDGGVGMMDPSMMSVLTDEQRQEVQTMKREGRRQHMEAMLAIMDARDELQEELMTERPDPERVRELQRRMAEQQGEIMGFRVEMQNRLRDLLSDEQRQQMQQMMREPQREMPQQTPRGRMGR